MEVPRERNLFANEADEKEICLMDPCADSLGLPTDVHEAPMNQPWGLGQFPTGKAPEQGGEAGGRGLVRFTLWGS